MFEVVGPILPASTTTPAPGHPPTDVLLAGPKARLAVERTTDEEGGLHNAWMVRFSFSISLCGDTNTHD